LSLTDVDEDGGSGMNQEDKDMLENVKKELRAKKKKTEKERKAAIAALELAEKKKN